MINENVWSFLEILHDGLLIPEAIFIDSQTLKRIIYKLGEVEDSVT
mgnify:CR=1 FL=1